MRPSTIWYTLKQGIKNIKRNFMFSIASIITMAACIFLFGIFFSIVNNVNTLAHKVEEDVPITVLFNEGTTQEQMDAVGELIKARPEVSKIEFESGDEAWEKMKQEYFGDDSEAADGFKDDNPLANSSNYRVYMNNIEKQSELVAYIKTLDNVREVNQSEQAAKTLGSINRIVSYVSVAVIVILLLIAIFRTALNAPDEFGRYLCVGVGTVFAMHSIVNIGMSIRLMPVTGQPLPLVSYGGTFMLASLSYLGIVQSVYVRRNRNIEE